MAFFILLALLIRGRGLDRTSLWFDEVNSWEVTQLPWSAMLAHLRASPVGPLYFMLLKPWQLVFGDSETSLRAPSLIAGLLLIPVTYAIGSTVLTRRAAVLGALLVACSPLHLYLSQEARMYMPLALLGGVCALAYVRWRSAIRAPKWRSHRPARDLILYALSGLALLFTNVVAAPLLVALNLDAAITLLERSRAPDRGVSRHARAWIAANAAIALPVVAYLLTVSLGTAIATQGWRPPLGPVDAARAFLRYPLTAVHGVYYYPHDAQRLFSELLARPRVGLLVQEWRRLVVEPLALLAIVAALRNLPRNAWRGPERVLLLATIVPVASGAIASISRQLDLGRYMVFASPFLFLLMADGLTRMRGLSRVLALVTILAAMGLGVGRYREILSRDSDYRPVGRFLRRAAGPGEPVVAAPGASVGALTYYLRDPGAPPLVAIPDRTPPATWLTGVHARQAWLVLDYRSPLYEASPDSVHIALAARVVRDRYDIGTRVLLLARDPRSELGATPSPTAPERRGPAR